MSSEISPLLQAKVIGAVPPVISKSIAPTPCEQMSFVTVRYGKGT